MFAIDLRELAVAQARHGCLFELPSAGLHLLLPTPGVKGQQLLVAPRQPIRILSVEDHPVFREGLAAIIGSQKDMVLVAQATNGADAILQFRIHRPDVTLMDLQLPKMSGIEALGAIRAEFPEARILVLTTTAGDVEIKKALQAGASGYALKSLPTENLLALIRSIHSGKKQVPPEVASKLAEHLGDENLTDREIDVLKLIRDGYQNKSIADELGISLTTVNFHIRNIVGKLGANDRTHAVTIAVRRGVLRIEAE